MLGGHLVNYLTCSDDYLNHSRDCCIPPVVERAREGLKEIHSDVMRHSNRILSTNKRLSSQARKRSLRYAAKYAIVRKRCASRQPNGGPNIVEYAETEHRKTI